MNTDITMETSDSSPLAIACKPVGSAVGIGGPLKPIAHGFAHFFEALLSAVPAAKTDVTDITTHTTEDSPHSIATDNDVEAFVELAADPVSDIPAETVDIVREESIIIAEVNDCAKPSDAVDDEVIEVVTEVIATEEIVALEIDEATLTEDTTTIETCSIQSQPEAEVTTEELAEIISAEDATELPIEITAPTHEQEVFDEIVDIEATHATHPEEDEPDLAEIQSGFETVHDFDQDISIVFEPTAAALNTTTNGIFVEDSESDIKGAIQDILDDNKGVDFETDIEAEVEEELMTPEAPASVAESTESDTETDELVTPIATPAYALVLEDDFDAAISSIFDTEFENLLDNDNAWSVPQVVEKVKSDKDLVRERLANKETAKFNAQNFRLEKAAKALTIDGTVLTLHTPKSSASAAEQSAPASPIEPEHEEIIAATEEESAEPTPITFVEPEQEEPITAATEDKTEELEAFSDNEDAIALAKDIATCAKHSRHSSSSSANSQLSAGAGSVNEPCPGTPVTEYSATPEKPRAPDTEHVANLHQATVEDAEEEDEGYSTTE